MIIDKQIYSGDITNGNVVIPIKNLTIGKYLATVTFEGDLYNVEAFNTYVNIKSSINASDLTKSQDSDAKFQAAFFDFNGNVLKNTKVTFMLNNGLQTIATDNNGVATLNIDLPMGNYDITLLNPVTDEIKVNQIVITSASNNPIIENNTNNTNISDGNITNCNVTDINNTDNLTGENTTNTNITNATEGNTTGTNTTKPTPEIIVLPLDKPSSDGSVTITLPSDATGKVTLSINGKSYNYVVENGVANVIIPNLGDGDYPYTITYSGDSKYASFTNNGSLKVNKTNITPVENQTNSTVNPADNKTGNTENNTPHENTTVVDNSKIVASNVNVVYSAGSYYTITVYGTNGELADGVNVEVSGKISKSLTTTNGVVKFKVTQVPGTYKITISALGKSVSKTITVKKATPKMTAKAKTFKKSVKTKKYSITLKTNTNKVMKKAKLTLKVNGKTYSATTNAKGQATFKITKLTKKGKFTAVVKFAGNKYYNAKTVNAKITVK